MFPGRNPDPRSCDFGVHGGATRHLAGIADGILVGCCVPVESSPLSDIAVVLQESRHVFCIQVMSHLTAIPAPEVVIVQLHPITSEEGLTVDRSIVIFDNGV